jgi:hypothetical protein
MTNQESIQSMIDMLDPATVGVVVIISLGIIVKYHEKIAEVLKVYFKKTDDSGDGSTSSSSNTKEDLFDSIRSIQTSIDNMNSIQTQLVSNQLDLSNNLKELQDNFISLRDETDAKLSGIITQQEFLLNVDIEDRKLSIINAYNYYYIKLGVIDIRTKENLEKSYEAYLKEGGNTFVAELMTKIRELNVIPEISQELIDEKLGSSKNKYYNDTRFSDSDGHVFITKSRN